ncbi:hypothetical protein SDRG_06082 [Saprolegnia diclina VS20]|uniref:Uncharacterized protein n=1 Tax=Saprolegnia diclina (strain VS20) TaxID=1156394 RepID=T0QFD0_SAPDV|nr:hypothetical protein SDRG_06082 [Saprolegnia diclina VS20]EQC36644.1 hypothetical protein SDRG_06082 [Saprolegnia diclina VS20]|eukprot:XP_008610065.1 hypothetical protein SDRG_06082 [Saprolegnia diclina VS20]
MAPWRRGRNAVKPFATSLAGPHLSLQYLHAPRSTPRHYHVVAGFAYVLFSLLVAAYYLQLLAPSLTNVLFWPGLNQSGYQAYLIDAANAALATASVAAPVSSPLSRFAIPMTYYGSLTPPETTYYATYARRIALTELISLEEVIPMLRTMHITNAKGVRAQQCWVDWNKTWEVAHTTARQARCANNYAPNGAVYYESVLRNVNVTAFLAAYGGVGNEFTVAIQTALLATPAGSDWLTHMTTLRHGSVADEIAQWRTHGLREYRQLWHNQYGTGVLESLAIVNALGMTEAISLKTSASSHGPWTSVIWYWLPANDWSTVQALNMSLVRGAINDYRRVLAFEDFLGVQNNGSSYINQTGLAHHGIGPFLSIDPWLLPVPTSLVMLHTKLTFALSAHLSTSAGYENLATISVALQVPSWDASYTYYGGNPLCLYNSPSASPQASLSFEDNCDGNASLLTMTLAPVPLLYTLLILNGSLPDASFCAGNAACTTLLDAAAMAVPAVPPMMHDAVVSTIRDVMALTVGFLQFATDANENWHLLFAPLNASSSAPFAWQFSSWLLLFDWVLGVREVVAVDGDAATHVVLSSESPRLSVPAAAASDLGRIHMGNRIVWYLAVYASCIALFVALLCVGFAARSARWRIEGQNLLFFNRLTAATWVGRPLTLLRGGTALLLLSTAPYPLQLVDEYTFLQWQPRPLLQLCVLAGEATWITYVGTDVLCVSSSGRAPGTLALRSAVTFFVWLTLVVYEVTAPILPTLSLQPSCTTTGMDLMLSCTSGTLAIGDKRRFLALGAICMGGAVLGAVVARALDAYDAVFPGPRNLVVSALAASCLDTNIVHEYDVVACVLCGVLRCTTCQEHVSEMFHLRLWSCTRVDTSVASMSAVLPQVTTMPLSQRHWWQWPHQWNQLFAVAGVVYIGASMVSGLLYLDLTRVSLANDMCWGTFNMTSTHVFLANWITKEIQLSPTTSSDTSLTLPSIGAIQSPRESSTGPATLSVPASLGATLQYTALRSISAAITGFRRAPPTSACDFPWIFTQYCFLDLNRSWEMANSATRQARCVAHMTTNGAVYLEPALRNLHTRWRDCWGAAFEIAVAAELRTSRRGQAWLLSLEAPLLSLDAEVAFWTAHGLQHYTTQWQTFKAIGVSNSYAVENALGMQFSFPIAATNLSFAWDIATSHKMYWALGNDLRAVARNDSGVAGCSLLRLSANYAFRNVSMPSLLTSNGTLLSPLDAGLSAVTHTLGPFGSIDMFYVPPPRSLQSLFHDSLRLLRTVFASTPASQAAYLAMAATGSVIIVPHPWRHTQNLSTVGGSILCPNISPNPIWNGCVALTARTSCSTINYASTVSKAPEYLVLAALFSRALDSDVPRLCDVVTTGQIDCLSYMADAIAFTKTYLRNASDAILDVSPVVAELALSHVSIAQLLKLSKGPVTVATAPIFEPNVLPFFNWMYAYDWVLGLRDVVAFVGDNNFNLTLLTENTVYGTRAVDASMLPTTISNYARACVVYVTSGMLAMALLVLLYLVYARGHVEGLNLLSLQSVGAIVWLGRPMLFVRSVSALCLLSTATLTLVQNGAVVAFTSTEYERPWYAVLVASSEVLWLALIVNDVGMVWTQAMTPKYTPLHRAIVYCSATLLTSLDPVQHTLSLGLQCYLAQVDAQVVCNSAVIRIGELRRLVSLVVLVLSTQVLSYMVVRAYLYMHKTSLTGVPSTRDAFFMYAGAHYFFCRAKWTVDGVYYVDPASAVLNGNLVLPWRGVQYVLDIKLWRIAAVAPHSAMPEHHPMHAAARYAIRLGAQY